MNELNAIMDRLQRKARAAMGGGKRGSAAEEVNGHRLLCEVARDTFGRRLNAVQTTWHVDGERVARAKLAAALA